MDEYYQDLKRAIKALEKYVTSLEKDDYDFLYSSFKRISTVQKKFSF